MGHGQVPWLLVLLCVSLSGSDCRSSSIRHRRSNSDNEFRINSPRKPAAAAGNPSPPGQAILVKLPDNIEEQMHRHINDRQRMREAMLGFPAMFPLEDSTVAPSNKLSRQEDSASSIAADSTTASSAAVAPARATNAPPGSGTSWPNSGAVGSPSIPRSWSTTTSTTTRLEPQQDVHTDDEEFSKKEPTESRSVWSIAWEAHVYFSGTLFVLLALYGFINMLRLHTFSRLFSRGYFVSLNLCIVFMGILRPVWLFHDPYNVGGTWSRYGAYLLVDTGMPCMTSAFAVLFLALLRATQIELVSPAFQTPRSLGAFCACHFLLSFAVDITIGLYFYLRYMVLILQGIFIVWSLLLSAGYFYIFSSMNKIALRQQGELLRSVYPKLILEDTVTHPDTGQIHPISSSLLKRPPLARAVHLTLGVAVLGSLLGGVQLFGMIKMLGLLKEDMSSSQNEWAWYGYQVSMRILEVTLCTLLAVIATTPLRSESGPSCRMATTNGAIMEHSGYPMLDQYASAARNPDAARTHSSWFCCSGSSCTCCCADSPPRREFEDDIYSEICSNNQSVRQIMSGNGEHANYTSTLARNHHSTAPNGHAILPLGTMGPSSHISVGSNTLLPYKRSHPASRHYPSQSQTLLRSSTHYHDPVQTHGNSMASSRATLDTALYSNIRSRPSSMLFNDAGFVRFRLANELPTSSAAAASAYHNHLTNSQFSQVDQVLHHDKDKLRMSQDFDDTVLFLEAGLSRGTKDDLLSPAMSQPDNPIGALVSVNDNIKRKPDKVGSGSYRSTESDTDLQEIDQKLADLDPNLKDEDNSAASESDEEEENIYEPEPGSKKAARKRQEPPQPFRASSQCSSVSATQSFDMRMYGRVPGHKQFGTLQQHPQKEKLSNPYYYYGSTKNQKKVKPQFQKPRPLLPSQRRPFELLGRQSESRPRSQMDAQRPSSRQALLPQSQQELMDRQQMAQQQYISQASQPQNPQPQQNFQRSRSLGHHYQQPAVLQQEAMCSGQPTFGQPTFGQPQGSLTPLSHSRWLHNRQQQQQQQQPMMVVAGSRRYVSMHDTPPSQRHVKEIRGVMGTPPIMNRGLGSGSGKSHGSTGGRHRDRAPLGGLAAPSVLSPILTDQELSPLHNHKEATNVSTGSASEDNDDELTIEDQATQGYSEGLADNEQDADESEGSSVFGQELENVCSPAAATTSSIGVRPDRGGCVSKPGHVLSPLEYSAILKLYNTTSDNEATPDPTLRMQQSAKSDGMKDAPADAGRMGSTQQGSGRDGARLILSSSSSSLSASEDTRVRPRPRSKVTTARSPSSCSSSSSSPRPPAFCRQSDKP